LNQTNLVPPAITKYSPALLPGADSIGIGETRHGERYLLKPKTDVSIAEFIGAAVCKSCGVPVAEPTVVLFRGRRIFGSRLESGVSVPNTTSELAEQVKVCQNASIFSAVLAIDLSLGNGDRHWHNWLPQHQADGKVFVRTVDFSRGWPTIHPPVDPGKMERSQTADAWRIWPSVGIQYDQQSAFEVCDTMSTLTSPWLSSILADLPTSWFDSQKADALAAWWDGTWETRVAEVKEFLNNGAWK
jgi:hypothetical protein